MFADIKSSQQTFIRYCGPKFMSQTITHGIKHTKLSVNDKPASEKTSEIAAQMCWLEPRDTCVWRYRSNLFALPSFYTPSKLNIKCLCSSN